MKSPMDTSLMQASSLTASTKASEGPIRAGDAQAKLEREASIGGTVSATASSPNIDIPPPRPKRKPSHPYPRKAGGASSSSRSFEEAGKSPPAVCSSFRPLGSPTERMTWKPSSKVLQEEVDKTDLSSSLRLFGKTMIVAGAIGSNLIVEYVQANLLESKNSALPLEGETVEENSSPSIVELRAFKTIPEHEDPASDSTEGESLQTEVLDVDDFETSKNSGNAINDKATIQSPLSGHSPHTSSNFQGHFSKTGPQCGFTPWHPLPGTVAQQDIARRPSPLPTFWQAPPMSKNAETFSDRWSEDTSAAAAAAAAMAAATFAMVSAWQQAIQASIPLSSSHHGSVVYSPVAVVRAAENSVTEAGMLLPSSPLSVEQHETMDQRETSRSSNCESNNIECTAKMCTKRSTASCNSDMSDVFEAFPPEEDDSEDMQNSDSYTCSMARGNALQVEVSNDRGARNNGNSLSMFKAGAVILSSRYSGAGFVPYKRQKRLKISHASGNPVQPLLQEFST